MRFLHVIRNRRHLKKLLEANNGRIGIYLRSYSNCDFNSEGICTIDDRNNVYFFVKDNNLYRADNEVLRLMENNQSMKDLLSEYGYPIVMKLHHFRAIYEITVYYKDKDFDSQYDEFYKQNKNAISKINVTESLSKFIFDLSNGSINYYKWIFKCIIDGIDLRTIKSIMLYTTKYKHKLSNLEKSTITAYKPNECLSLLNELFSISIEKRYHEAINLFNTAQKKALKSYSFSYRDKINLVKFLKMSSVKKSNFIRKMSTIEDASEILRSLQMIISLNVPWTKSDYLDYIRANQDFKYNIVYDKDSVLVIEVLDFHTICKLGKNTNWCISKSIGYWKDYVSSNQNYSQYMSFDFSLKEDSDISIIGFTINKNNGKITNAHSYSNEDILLKHKFDIFNYVELIPMREITNKEKDCINVYQYLKNRNIPLSLFVKGTYTKWNYELFNEYLKKNDLYDDSIMLYKDDKKCIMYFNKQNTYDTNGMYIIGDFTKEIFSSDRVIWVMISKNNEFNIHYDFYCTDDEKTFISNDKLISLLSESDVPFILYNKIDTKAERFLKCLSSYKLSKLQEYLLSAEEVKKLNSSNKCIINRCFLNSYISYHSRSLFDLIYENGKKLSTYISNKMICTLIMNIIVDIHHKMTVEYIDYQKELDLLYEIYTKEKNQNILKMLCKSMHKLSIIKKNYPIYDLIKDIIESANIQNEAKAIQSVILYAYNTQNENILDYIIGKASETAMEKAKSNLHKEVIEFCDKVSYAKSIAES